MKINRRQLKKIIRESLSEESFIDKVKKKGKDIKDKATTAIDRTKGEIDTLKGKLGSQEQDVEQEVESRKDYVNRVLSDYEYKLGASGKLLAKKTTEGVKLDLTFKIVGSLPGNFNIYVRQPNGSSFVVLHSRSIDMLGLSRGIGKDPSDAAHVKEFIIKKFIELKGKPAASVDQTSDQDNLKEGLSRGSLYRKSYHGRY